MNQLEPGDCPDWQVTAVYDPECDGGDFAYTTGLAAHGVPDLHMWARPTGGQDPGLDWKFSQLDQGRLLNRFATALIAGELAVGDEREETFDDDTVTVVFRFDPPQPAESLDALDLPPNAPVIGIRWSLHRPPPGALTPLSADAAEEVCAESCSVITETSRRSLAFGGRPGGIPKQWQPVFHPAGHVDTSLGQRFGPLHPLVVAHVGALVEAPSVLLTGMLEHALITAHAGLTSMARTQVVAHARLAGRHEVIARIDDAIPDIVRLVVGTSGRSRRWREAAEPFIAGHPTGERDQLLEGLAHELHHAIQVLLTGEAIADVAPPHVRAASSGPWAWARSGDRIPGPLWEADEDHLDAVVDLFGDWSADQYAELAHVMRLAHQTDAYCETTSSLHAHQLTGPFSVWAGGWADVMDDAGELVPEDVAAEVTDAMDLVLVAVAARNRIGDDHWARLVAPMIPLAPWLAERPRTRVPAA